MSKSFESVPWNARAPRLDLGLYSHPNSFWGMESELKLTPREKFPLPETQRRLKAATLHHARQPGQHTTNWAILTPRDSLMHIYPLTHPSSWPAVCLLVALLILHWPIASSDNCATLLFVYWLLYSFYTGRLLRLTTVPHCCLFIGCFTHSTLADCFVWQLCHTRGFVQVMKKKKNTHKKTMQPLHLVTTCMLKWNNTWQYNFNCVIVIWLKPFSNKSLFSNVNILILVCYSAHHQAEPIRSLGTL